MKSTFIPSTLSYLEMASKLIHCSQPNGKRNQDTRSIQAGGGACNREPRPIRRRHHRWCFGCFERNDRHDNRHRFRFFWHTRKRGNTFRIADRIYGHGTCAQGVEFCIHGGSAGCRYGFVRIGLLAGEVLRIGRRIVYQRSKGFGGGNSFLHVPRLMTR